MNTAKGMLKNYIKNPSNVKNIITVLTIVIALTAGMFIYFNSHAGGGVDDGRDVVIKADGENARAGEEAAMDASEFSGSVTGGAVSGGQGYELEEEKIMVDVAGAVLVPMVVELRTGSRVYEAIESAGGLRDDADMREINKAFILQDGDRIYVPTKEESKSGTAPAGAGSGERNGNGGSPAGSAASGKVNINTADEATLQTLTGVGPVTAKKIIDYRDGTGKFKSIEELKKVSGIGDKTFEKMKDYIIV